VSCHPTTSTPHAPAPGETCSTAPRVMSLGICVSTSKLSYGFNKVQRAGQPQLFHCRHQSSEETSNSGICPQRQLVGSTEPHRISQPLVPSREVINPSFRLIPRRYSSSNTSSNSASTATVEHDSTSSSDSRGRSASPRRARAHFPAVGCCS